MSLSESGSDLGVAELALSAPLEMKGDLGTEFGDGSNNRCGRRNHLRPRSVASGGMQAVGDYLLVAAEGLEGRAPFVEFVRRSADAVDYQPPSRLTLHGDLCETVLSNRFITAAAMARLGTGRHLLFVLGKDEDQQGWFYLSDDSRLDASTAWRFLARLGC